MANVERAIRTAMIKPGLGLLERLQGHDNGHRGTQVGFPGGHLAEFFDYYGKFLS